MGWSGGSYVMDRIITGIELELSFEERKYIYKIIINAMEDEDWDTQDECMGQDKAFDAAMKELHPDWFEEDLAWSDREA